MNRKGGGRDNGVDLRIEHVLFRMVNNQPPEGTSSSNYRSVRKSSLCVSYRGVAGRNPVQTL